MIDREVAVTGANGLIGRHVCTALSDAGWRVRAVVRAESTAPACVAEVHGSMGIDLASNWETALAGTRVVVHCAGVTEVRTGDSDARRQAFTDANVTTAVRVARAAVSEGVEKLIFMSSVSVYGRIGRDVPVDESTRCNPAGLYPCSKYRAERELADLCAKTATELVILRPALVYGPRCSGSFSRLVKLAQTGLPLPLGRFAGNRSFLSIDNLASLVLAIGEREARCGGTYNVADRESLDLRRITELIGDGLGRTVRLWPCPKSLLKHALQLIGQRDIVEKLDCPVLVDSGLARERFHWTDVVSADTAMPAAAASFTSKRPPPTANTAGPSSTLPETKATRKTRATLAPGRQRRHEREGLYRNEPEDAVSGPD